ncbi:hypothetical protein KI387_009261, partial [Taxus chinensis]
MQKMEIPSDHFEAQEQKQTDKTEKDPLTDQNAGDRRMQMNPRLKDQKKGFKTKGPPVYRKLWRPKIHQSKNINEAQKEIDLESTKGEESKRVMTVDPAMNTMTPNSVKLSMEVDEENEKVFIHLITYKEEEMEKTSPSAHQELLNRNSSLEILKMRQGKVKEVLESIARDLNQDKEFTDMEELAPKMVKQTDVDTGKEEGEITPTSKKILSDCDKDGFITVRSKKRGLKSLEEIPESLYSDKKKQIGSWEASTSRITRATARRTTNIGVPYRKGRLSKRE